jgi:hypothetical protein
MQKTGFFTKIIFCSIIFKVSAWLSNNAVCKIGLKAYFRWRKDVFLVIFILWAFRSNIQKNYTKI